MLPPSELTNLSPWFNPSSVNEGFACDKLHKASGRNFPKRKRERERERDGRLLESISDVWVTFSWNKQKTDDLVFFFFFLPADRKYQKMKWEKEALCVQLLLCERDVKQPEAVGPISRFLSSLADVHTSRKV